MAANTSPTTLPAVTAPGQPDDPEATVTTGTASAGPPLATSEATAALQPTPGERRRDRWMAGAVGGLALLVYIRTLMPGIGYSGDATKWQMMSVVGGIPHATGYPLYVALIQAFGDVVPVGSAAWRTNLFSAVCGAVAVAVLYLLLRSLGARWTGAAAAALTFAFTKVFWTQAVIAEVYTLHLLFIGSVFLCLTRWRTGGSNRWLMAGTALMALSFGNHLSTVLAIPGVLWILWSGRKRALTLANALWAALVGVLGASQYLYLLYMYDVGGYVELPMENLGDIWSTVTGGPFKDQMFVFTPQELVQERIPLVWRFMREEYLILLVPIAYGLVRAIRLDRPRRDAALGVALLGLGSAFYGMNFDVQDVIVFFLPLFLALAVFLGIGLDGVVSWVERRMARAPDRSRQLAGVAAATALLAIPSATLAVDYAKASQRGTVTVAERTEAALDTIGSHAVIVTDNYDDSEFFWYYLLGENLGEERELALVQLVTPEEVQTYFDREPGVVMAAATQLRMPAHGDIPPVYTVSASQADIMEDAGLRVVPMGSGVYRIEPGD